MNLVFEYHRVVFEWEGFGLEPFPNDRSLYTHTHTQLPAERTLSTSTASMVAVLTKILRPW